MMKHRHILALCAGVAALALQSACAAPGIAVSGFLSIVGGRVLNGSLQGPMPDNADVNCPCYIADYANFGTYDGALSLAAESRIGLQAVATLTDNLSLTGQLTARGTDGTAQLQWAYATYALSPTWDFQIGRKRIPLYFYSDFQDVGVAYPWVGLPPELYGWETTNYNGVSLRNRTAFGGVYVSSSVFAGSEQVKDNRYMLSFGQHHTDVRWNNLLGGDVELSKGALTVRAVALRADTSNTDRDDPTNDDSGRMTAYGLAANLDFNHWFVLSEIATNIRSTDTGALAGLTLTIPAISIGVGYRFGAWTTFLNYAAYQERSSDPELYTSTEYRHTSLTLKYELTPNSVLKTQLDRYWEPGGLYTPGRRTFGAFPMSGRFEHALPNIPCVQPSPFWAGLCAGPRFSGDVDGSCRAGLRRYRCHRP